MVEQIKFLSVPDKDFNLPLHRIILLCDSPIPNASLAMREVNELHLASMMEVDTDKLPPIKVALIEEGAILVDGRHRVERATRKGEETILAKAGNYTSAYQVLNDAFYSNTIHGLPLSMITRTAYGIWLVITANEMGETLSVRQAAKIAGVSHTAINKALDKLKNEDKQKDDKFSSDNVKPTVVQKLSKALYAYFKDEYELFSNDIYGVEAERARAITLANYFKQAKNKESARNMLSSLARSIHLATELMKE